MSKDLTRRIQSGIVSKLGGQEALSRLQAKFSKTAAAGQDSRQRIVLLDMNFAPHVQLWNVIYNTPEVFQVVEKKVSHQKEEYTILLHFIETGEDLPISRTLDDFITIYVKKTDDPTPAYR